MFPAADVEGDKNGPKIQYVDKLASPVSPLRHAEQLERIRELSINDSGKPRSDCEVVICET